MRIQRSYCVEEWVLLFNQTLGLSMDELAELRKPVRGRRRPLIDILIYLLWNSGEHRLERIADYFALYDAAIPAARISGQRYIEENDSLRATRCDVLEKSSN